MRSDDAINVSKIITLVKSKKTNTMKLVLLFSFISFLPQIIVGQTAEEIICKTEDEYRKHSNYIDQGLFSLDIYSTTLTSKSFNYFLAMDSVGNVYHWINEFQFGKTIGVIYSKKASDTLGTYQRLGYEEEPFSCSLYHAGGRLLATGGGILWLTASMFYPEYLEETPGDASRLQHFDEIKRLPDTLIGSELCFVVETITKFQRTQKMADDSNRRGDSIRVKNGFEPIFHTAPFKQLPEEIITKVKYFIQAKEYKLIRCEEIQYALSQLKSKRTLKMAPVFDTKDFANSLQQ